MKIRVIGIIILLISFSVSMDALAHNTDHNSPHGNASSPITIDHPPQVFDELCIQHSQSQEVSGSTHEDCRLCTCCSIVLPPFINHLSEQAQYPLFISDLKLLTLVEHSLRLLRPPID